MSRTSAASCERCGVDFARCRRARGLGICVDCRETDPEIAAKKRAYYEQNRDEIAAKQRAQRQADPERHREYVRKYRARKKAATPR